MAFFQISIVIGVYLYVVWDDKFIGIQHFSFKCPVTIFLATVWPKMVKMVIFSFVDFYHDMCLFICFWDDKFIRTQYFAFKSPEIMSLDIFVQKWSKIAIFCFRFYHAFNSPEIMILAKNGQKWLKIVNFWNEVCTQEICGINPREPIKQQY